LAGDVDVVHARFRARAKRRLAVEDKRTERGEEDASLADHAADGGVVDRISDDGAGLRAQRATERVERGCVPSRDRPTNSVRGRNAVEIRSDGAPRGARRSEDDDVVPTHRAPAAI